MTVAGLELVVVATELVVPEVSRKGCIRDVQEQEAAHCRPAPVVAVAGFENLDPCDLCYSTVLI